MKTDQQPQLINKCLEALSYLATNSGAEHLEQDLDEIMTVTSNII